MATKQSPLKVAEEYERANVAIAKMFLRDPTKYGGPDGWGVRWAKLVLANSSKPKSL